ncbi:MAG: hypothetical protein ACI4B6_06525 [Atopobiaceae bacterium]
MDIVDIQDRTPQLVEDLLGVWERSVRATHGFLASDDVERIRGYVPQAVGFYKHMGFVMFACSQTDDVGEPFPLLRMRLQALPQYSASCAENRDAMPHWGRPFGNQCLGL